MPFVVANGIRLYYEIHGTGPRLLGLNRTGGDLRQRPGLADLPLSREFELLLFDPRGLGQSDRPDRPCTMADYAADACALLDAVGWSSCAAMGVSFGGMVAQELALRYPTRVTQLALVCTSSGGAGGASYPLHTLDTLPELEQAEKLVELLDTRRDARWAARHPGEFAEMRDRILAALRFRADEPGRRTGMRRLLEARAAHDTWERLPQLSMPVFVCGGRFDGIASVENITALRQRIPGAVLEVFDGGHQFYLENPAVSASISAFLRGGAGRGRS
ncbi:MAG: alpha/beta hydrolase [Gammaproteobacteria bacterium]|nr:alpha/beta hydrolase [Gammaproteobacteria bacterium]